MLISELLPLLSATDRETLVLTPNQRLGRFLQSQYSDFMRSQGREAWPAYPCQSLTLWYQSQWLSWLDGGAVDAPCAALLSADQENALWLDIVREHHGDLDIFNPAATAGVAKRAWHSLVRWQCGLDELSPASAICRWVRIYLDQCARKQVIDLPSATQRLLTAFETGKRALPAHIVLFAFDDVDPQLQRLLTIAKDQGSRIEHVNLVRDQSQCARCALSDADAEIEAAARWAAAQLTQNSDIRVGIVVPQLAQQRDSVERIFTRVFEPQYFLPDKARHANAFNISAGIPLNQTPPVAAALRALKLLRGQLDIEDLSHFLLSPFIADGNEQAARARLDIYLRERHLRVSLRHLMSVAGEFGKSEDHGEDHEEKVHALADFYQRLHDFHQHWLSMPKYQAPSQWAQFFCHQLANLGWPGTRAPDTLEYQQLEIWQQTLELFAGFDHLFPSISLSRALELIASSSFDTSFQAQTTDSPVQVLGVFEAAGMMFDHLWVMNLDSDAWPAPVSPNALLPLALQKTKQMPLASNERELLLTKKLTTRLQQSATNVVFSHSTHDGDKVLRASPLIEHLPETSPSALASMETADYRREIHQHGGLEAFVDSCGPRLDNVKNVRGGTQILKDQAACPFRAFAIHRLAARRHEDATPGLNAAERGSLIHKALEIIWKRLRKQSALLAMGEDALQALIKDSIDQSFRGLESKKNLGSKLRQLENDRLKHLLHAWLELEKRRTPFTVMFSEKIKSVQLAKLPIHVRYDRIDRLSDDSWFVVDYKTGKLDVRRWAGERPDEPQVPIYAVANKGKVTAAAFGQINVDEVAFKGIASDPDIAPGLIAADALNKTDLPRDWPAIIEHWRGVLENLAKEFIAGSADVKPKSLTQSCRYCHLHSLCRINEYVDVDDDDEPLDLVSIGQEPEAGQ